ncbi:MAG: isoleucine--tRNA ligase [Proteobacteria bacterium]|nr:isoleucine--tRNA ligase [Pseudomonadota bacterium]
MTEKRSYKSTLNLPRTRFAMKANLVQREPQFQKRWERLDVYARLRTRFADRPEGAPRGRFTFHDGPPYANGEIHLGHLLNKVLKDLVVRTRSMQGYDVDFVPGWDCHGLPIEHKVLQELGEEAARMSAPAIRDKCERYARKYVKLQSQQMRRLGTVGNYADPYLTMSPGYEGAVLEVFARLLERGAVFRALKPVHWSVENRTALAEAELEYYEREDTSVYALFLLAGDARLPASLGAPEGDPVELMIWTTTPWTLPANRAVAVAPGARYGLYRFELPGAGPRQAILAESLAGKVFPLGGIEEFEPLGSCSGRELLRAGIDYRHPLSGDGRRCPVVGADYVTLEDGTGLVHTAPGHGLEDYHTGLAHDLEVYCPVRADGTFDASVPEWLRGLSVWDANPEIVERLREDGRLFHAHRFTHSYPHDWRGKTPTIFRATEQWFAGVDRELRAPDGPTLRELALRATEDAVSFVPEWGRNRMRGMLETRPDWCLSRQRAWGLPIPAFYGDSPDQILLTPASVRAIAERVRAEGSGTWFRRESAELLDAYDPGADPDAPEWLRERADLADLRLSEDIFDVWFESGSSWNAVLRERDLGYPADLYLEGSDQHRGWFQTSLLPSLGATGSAPFRGLLTHGFIVDAQGLKMSKSGGNALAVEDLLRDHGADVCRWWVSSLNYANDVKVDREYFRLAGEEYRKVRNTLRFLLGNLGDFDPERDRREPGPEDRHSLDAWARARFDELVATLHRAYDGYQYRAANRALFDFCNESMSAVYLAAVKDRLYCDPPDSERRRRCQTLLWDVASGLTRLLAPILVHTADEAWLALHGLDPAGDACVHDQLLPEPREPVEDPDWSEVMNRRDQVLKALEEERNRRGLDNPLDAGVALRLPAGALARLRPFEAELPDLFGVSRVALEEEEREALEVLDLRGEPRCERSWKRDDSVRRRSDGGWLSERDAAAVGM